MTSTLPASLTSAVPGYYRLIAPLNLEHLRSLPCALIHVNASGLTTRDEVLARFAVALAAPMPITNWDALIDVLRDLSWLPAAPRAIAITGLPARGSGAPALARDVEQALLAAATFWVRHTANAPVFMLELPAR